MTVESQSPVRPDRDPERNAPAAHRFSAPLRALGQYGAAVVLCLVVLGTVFDVRSEARRWPYAYRGDTMFYHLIAKSVVEHGWFLDVPLLSAPGTLNLRDVPTSDNNLHVAMLRVLALTTSHYPSVLNTFFLLTFPLIFLSALAVLRHFGVTWWTSVSVSLLYAFAPFHVLRGEHHLFLSAYWPIPLSVLVMLWVSGDALLPDGAARHAWRSSRVWLSVLICFILAASGSYYAFFACFFLLVASVSAAVRERRWRRLGPGFGLIALISVGVLVNLWPSLENFQRQGPAPIVRREPADADSYGLRIAQLLLPVGGHRVETLQEMKAEYNRRPLVNENDTISLGFAGAFGFVGLLWWFFFRKPAADGLAQAGAAGLLHQLSVLNIAGVLFGTIGGFGSLVAFFGLSQIRAYNRIGVFLAFFALLALALWLDELMRRYAVTRTRAIGFACALAVATVLALYDQISPKALPNYTAVKAQFASDATFVGAVERAVPRGAQIFQLPFVPFPEGLSLVNMQDYDLLRGYLHSTHLRWSYGTMRGREENAWFRQTAALPTNQLVEALVWAGFSGISINRDGFSDRGTDVEEQLRQLLDTPSVESPDGELVFYNLATYRSRLEQRTSPAEWEARREAALHPALAVWQEGFSDPEGAPHLFWRWAASDARMTLVNRAAHEQRVRLEMSVMPNADGTVIIRSPLFDEPVRVKRGNPRVERILRLPPGQYDVRFMSDAPHVHAPNDFRELVFAVQNFKLTPG